ncbi:prolyl oligopeptidase family serine peptidase [Aliikangiella sp. IMCC44359]|uniref:prolyl oligopeptidase family serine peptidase n=1 Tax=Aliikangiella sp. IMCC44359 TaxID=3459125 RepID=UPI00403AF52E
MKKLILIILIFTISRLALADIVPINELFVSPDIFSIKLSPNSQAYVSHFNEKKGEKLVYFDIKNKSFFALVGFPDGGSSYLKNYEWVDNETLYIEFKRKNGNGLEEAFLYINNQTKKAKLKLIKGKGYIVSYLENKKGKVLYAHKNKYSNYHLYEATLKQVENNQFKTAKVFEQELDDADVYFSDEKNEMLMALKIEGDKINFYYYDKQKKCWSLFYHYVEADYYFSPIGIIDKNKLAVLSNKDADLIGLYEFNIKNQQVGKLIYQHSRYDLTGASINSKEGKVDFVRYVEHGRLVTQYFSDEDEKLKKLMKTAFKGKQIITVSKKENSQFSIIKTFSSNDPGHYYLFNKKTLVAELIATQFEKLKKYTFSSSEVYEVDVEKAHKIEAILTRPQKNSNGVLLVIPHGGPIGVREFDTFDRETQYYTSRGYSVLKVNFRGSSGFGKRFQNEGVGEFGKSIEKDITSAVNFVKSKYAFKKMCSMGASYGGYSAIMLAIAQPKEYSCVVAMYGIYDLPLLFNQSNLNLIEENRESIERAVGKMRDELWDYSPFYFIEKLKAPLLLIAGKKDEIAGFEQSNRLKYRLKQLSTDYETIFYNNAAHGHHTWFGDRHELITIDNFIRRKLKLDDLRGNNINEIKKTESLILADGHNDKYFLDENSEISFNQYKKSAELGSDRAQFNVGSYYHQGKFVKYDIEKAVYWYKKSAENNYKNASYRLGKMYLNDRLDIYNESASYLFFERAEKQEHELAYLEIAKSKCLGLGVEQDVDSCFKILKLDQTKSKKSYSEKERDRRNEILSEIIWHPKFKTISFNKVKDFFRELFEIELASVSVEVEGEGLFKLGRYTYKYILDDETNIVPIKFNATFGSVLTFETDDELDDDAQTVIKYRWVTPEMFDKNGVRTKEQIGLRYPKIGKKMNFIYFLNRDEELIEGEWKLEIYTLDNELLYEKVFYTKKSDY